MPNTSSLTVHDFHSRVIASVGSGCRATTRSDQSFEAAPATERSSDMRRTVKRFNQTSGWGRPLVRKAERRHATIGVSFALALILVLSPSQALADSSNTATGQCALANVTSGTHDRGSWLAPLPP